MVTMADVARVAGVSTATVSHVLNGSRFVRDETRQRVTDALKTTGYMHNTLARSLAISRTNTVGVAISAISNPYFIDLVHAIESEIRQAGFTMLLTDTKDDPDEELRAIQTLHQRRVDGYLFAPSTAAHGRALEYLATQGLPTVLVDRLVADEFDQVGSENQEATSQLVEHLAAKGHRRIALLAGLKGLATTDERIDGYRLGLERSGLPYVEELIGSGASAVEPSATAVHELFALADPPTAIVAANNRMTIGAMRAMRDMGLVVPRDVAVVAFDDFEWADLFQPRLTVIAQPIHQMGLEAVRMLLSRLADPAQPPRKVQLTPEFVHRESCGCPASSALVSASDTRPSILVNRDQRDQREQDDGA